MIITTKQEKNGKITVFADGVPALTAEQSYWYSLDIYDDDDISAERLAEINLENERRKCAAAAYKFLSVRAYSERDVRVKLSKKFEPDAIDYAVARAKELGLIDDADYAQTLAEELLAHRHYAPSRIKLELRKRGVSRESAEAAADALPFDAQAEISHLLETKYRGNLRDERGLSRTAASLARMGYTYGEIKAAMGGFDPDEVFTDA